MSSSYTDVVKDKYDGVVMHERGVPDFSLSITIGVHQGLLLSTYLYPPSMDRTYYTSPWTGPTVHAGCKWKASVDQAR